MKADRATLHYTLSRARIYFADEHIACDYCPCLDTRTIGYNCPLEFEPGGGEKQ